MSEFTGVHYANQFNSTDFTDCCGLAVLRREETCPGCKVTVIRIKKHTTSTPKDTPHQ